MIGRGLRGPKVGGRKSCVLIDVVDNITGFGDQSKIYEEFYRSLELTKEIKLSHVGYKLNYFIKFGNKYLFLMYDKYSCRIDVILLLFVIRNVIEKRWPLYVMFLIFYIIKSSISKAMIGA